MNNYKQVQKGDIVILNDIYDGCNATLLKSFKSLKNTKYNEFVIIRKIDDSTFLIALCKKALKQSENVFQTNTEQLYEIKPRVFYSINIELFQKSGQYIKNPYDSISKIYDSHNRWVDEFKRKRNLAKSKQRKGTKKKPRGNKLLRHMSNSFVHKEILDPPAHIQWAVQHPYQGGGFSGK